MVKSTSDEGSGTEAVKSDGVAMKVCGSEASLIKSSLLPTNSSPRGSKAQ